MRLRSVAVRYAAMMAGMFAAAYAIAALISIGVVDQTNRDRQVAEAALASNHAAQALISINQRVAAYARVVAGKPQLAEVVHAGEFGPLKNYIVAEFEELKKSDPIISTFEVTNLIGIVMMRGHSPDQHGDDKSKLKDVSAAADGKPSSGLTVSPTSGQAALDALVPLKSSRGIVGTLKIGARLSPEMVKEISTQTATHMLVVYGGRIVASTLDGALKKSLEPDLTARVMAGEAHSTTLDVDGETYLAHLRHFPATNGEGIIVGALVPSAIYAERTAEFVTSIVKNGLFALPIVLMLASLFGWLIARPVTETAGALSALTRGQRASLEAYAKKRDEIGDMARAFDALKHEVVDAFRLRQTIDGMPTGVLTLDRSAGWTINYLNPSLIRRLGDEADHLPAAPEALLGQPSEALLGIAPAEFEALDAQGLRRPLRLGESAFILTVATIRSNTGEVLGAMVAWEDVSERGRLAGRFEAAVKNVADVVRDAALALRGRAGEVREAASRTQSQATSAASASEESAGSITTVASAAEELLASIEEIRRQIAESATFSGQASNQSAQVVSAVHELQQAADRIGTVVQLIGSIASQTNLLALNATIEAARAGEAGRGFAVVASEVKSLASQTARAAEEVVAQISSIQAKTGEAVTAIESISGVIARLNSLATGVAAAVEQQRNATDEIARNTQISANGTTEVAASIAEVTRASSDTEAASGDMLARSAELQMSVDTLRDEVDQFLKALAA